MKRGAKIVWANFKCWIHLMMPWNFLKGHCKGVHILTANGKKFYKMGAAIGSLTDNTFEFVKVFYDETEEYENEINSKNVGNGRAKGHDRR